MKKLFSIIIVILMTLSIEASSIKKDVSLVKYIEIYLNNAPKENEDPEHLRREPVYIVPCTIDTEVGLKLKGEGNVEILSYEIWQSPQVCFAAFEDEDEFIKVLFSLKGEYEIHLETADCTYIGNITL